MQGVGCTDMQNISELHTIVSHWMYIVLLSIITDKHWSTSNQACPSKYKICIWGDRGIRMKMEVGKGMAIVK